MGNFINFRHGLRAGTVLLAAVLGSLAGRAQAQNTQLVFSQAATVGTTANAANGMPYVTSAVTDAQGNTYLTGWFRGTVSLGPFALTSAGSRDVFVVKRDAAGTYMWAAQGGGAGNKQPTSVAVDAAGDVLVTGSFDSRTADFGGTTLTNASPLTASLNKDVFVARLSGSTHAWQWAVSAGGGTRINGEDIGQAVAVDALGNIYVAGTFDSSVAFFGPAIQVPSTYAGDGNVFLGKLTSAGQWQWVKGADYLGLEVGGLSTDPAGDVYLTGAFGRRQAVFGSFVLTAVPAAAFVAKINGAGTWQWATSLKPRRYTQYARMYAARPDGQGGLYLAGSYPGDTLVAGTTTLLNTGDIDSFTRIRTLNGYVARLHAGTGAWQWIVQTAGAGDEDFGPPQLDGAGHVLVAGSFSDLAGSYPSGTAFGPTTLYTAGSWDLVVAQLDTAGGWQWARQAGGTGSEGATLYGLDGQGHGLLVGQFVGPSVQLGTFSLQAPGVATGFNTQFTARLGANGPLAAHSIQAVAGFGVYPNPVRTAVTVAGLRLGQAVQVLDVLGRVVLTGLGPVRGELRLALPAGLPAGVYVVRAGEQARRLVVE